VFITEALGAGGALTRVTGPTAARLVTLDAPPRALLVDASHAYIVTPTRILRTPHERGALETIATGTSLAYAEADDTSVYYVTEVDKVKVIARIPKAGGVPTILVRDVRDAPIEVEGGEIFYLDAARPQLRAVPAQGGATRVVAEDEVPATASALEADRATIFVATGARETGAIVAFAR
jgi:hypothetical protein